MAALHHETLAHLRRAAVGALAEADGGQLSERADRLADAGTAVFNFALDAWDEKPGLPKALLPARKNLEYLIRKQFAYGYMVFFNMNICRNNLEDIRQLTEYAREHRLATDYHLNESPMLEQDGHFKHLGNNPTYIRPEDWPAVDDLIDWLIEKNRSGYQIVNSIRRLADMKDFMRGRVEPWNCRGGQNSIIIRTDGSLAPCFPMYTATYDWGTIENHKFDVAQLNEMKKTCQLHCFSTLNHILAFCYNDARVIKWLLRQAAGGFADASRASASAERVSNEPGSRLLMVTLCATVLRARPATKPVRPLRAPFDRPSSGIGALTALEVILTMRPKPRAFMPANTALVVWKTAERFRPMIASLAWSAAGRPCPVASPMATPKIFGLIWM